MSSSSSALVHVNTKDAPQAIGPYSQAVVANGFAFVSGQIPLTADGKLKAGNIKEQTALVLQNLSAVLKAAGASLNTVVKTTVYLKDMNDFAAMNEVYAEKFGDARPARAAIQVARLPKDVSVEIDAVAVVDQAKL